MYDSLLYVSYNIYIFYLLVPLLLLYGIYNYLFKYPFRDIKGDSVLITGGANGIGREMALQFAKEGVRHIVLWDIDEIGLQKVRNEILNMSNNKNANNKTECSTFIVDVSDRLKVYQAAAKLDCKIDILVNNAGILASGGKSLIDTEDEDIEKTFGVNTFAHLWTIKAFLSNMLYTSSGHIVTVASVASFCGGVGLSSYCASKYAALGLHEGIQYELNHYYNDIIDNNRMGVLREEKRGDGSSHRNNNNNNNNNNNRIRTTVICPYIIDTMMFNGAEPPVFYGLLSPLKKARVARRIVQAVRRGEEMVIVPWFLCIVIPIGRCFMPYSWMVKIMVLIFGNSMDNFSGSKR